MKTNGRHTKKALNYKGFSFLAGSPIAEEQKVPQKYSGDKFPIIPFFCNYNDFALKLAALAEVVPEHDGAIRAKRRWAINKGFTITRSNPSSVLNVTREEEETITDEEIQNVDSFVSMVNVEGENLKDLTRKVLSDLETVGNAYIEIIRGTAGGQRFFFLEHHDATTALLIRRERDIRVAFAADWQEVAGYGNTDVQVTELPLYKGVLTEWESINGAERAVIHLKQYRSGRMFYGLPESISSFMAQRTGFEISRHNLDRLETDFFPRLFFEFFNTDGMSEEEQAAHFHEFEKTFTKLGRSRHGIFAQYNEGIDTMTKVHKLELDKTGDFIEYKKQVRQDILTAHGIHPMIAGVMTPGSLGSGSEVREIFDLFNSTVIRPLQDFLEEQFLSPIMKEAAQWLGAMEGLFLTLDTATPVSFIGELDPNKLLTVNEGRAVLGLPELNDERGNELITDDEQDANPAI